MEVAVLTATLEARVAAFQSNMAAADAVLGTVKQQMQDAQKIAAELSAVLNAVKLDDRNAAQTVANADLMKRSLSSLQSQAQETNQSMDMNLGGTAAVVTEAAIQKQALKDLEDQALKTKLAQSMTSQQASGIIRPVVSPGGAGAFTPGAAQAEQIGVVNQNARERPLSAFMQMFGGPGGQRLFAGGAPPTVIEGAAPPSAEFIASQEGLQRLREIQAQRMESLRTASGAIPLGPVPPEPPSAADKWFQQFVQRVRGFQSSETAQRQRAAMDYLARRGVSDFGRGFESAVPSELGGLGQFLETAPEDILGGGGGGRRGRRGFFGGGGGGRGFLSGLLPGGRRASAAAVTTGIGILAAAGPSLVPAAAGLGAEASAGFTSLLGAAGTLKLAFADLTSQVFTNRQAFDKLTPIQQQFVQTLRSLDAGLGQTLEGIAQQTVLPGLTAAIHEAFTPAMTRTLSTGVGEFGAAIGGGAQQLGQLLGSNQFTNSLGAVMQADSGYVRQFFTEISNLTDAFVHLSQAAIPFTNWMTGSITDFTKWIDSSTKAAQSSGALAGFFDKARQSLEALGGLVSQVGNLFKAFGDAVGFQNSLDVIETLSRIVQTFVMFLQQNRNVLRDLFSGAIASANDIITAIQGIVYAMHPLLVAIDQVAKGFGGWRPIFDLVAAAFALKLGKGLIGGIASISKSIGTLGTSAATSDGAVLALGASLGAIARLGVIGVTIDILTQFLPQGKGPNPLKKVPILGNIFGAGLAAGNAMFGSPSTGTDLAKKSEKHFPESWWKAHPNAWVDEQTGIVYDAKTKQVYYNPANPTASGGGAASSVSGASGVPTGFGASGVSGKLSSSQMQNANLIYQVAISNGMTPYQALQLVAAAYAESNLNANSVNKSSGAAGLFQLLSPGYVNKANEMGGVFNPVANVNAIVGAYASYFQQHPNAPLGAAGAAVEASGQPASFYANPITSGKISLTNTPASAFATPEPLGGTKGNILPQNLLTAISTADFAYQQNPTQANLQKEATALRTAIAWINKHMSQFKGEDLQNLASEGSSLVQQLNTLLGTKTAKSGTGFLSTARQNALAAAKEAVSSSGISGTSLNAISRAGPEAVQAQIKAVKDLVSEEAKDYDLEKQMTVPRKEQKALLAAQVSMSRDLAKNLKELSTLSLGEKLVQQETALQNAMNAYQEATSNGTAKQQLQAATAYLAILEKQKQTLESIGKEQLGALGAAKQIHKVDTQITEAKKMQKQARGAIDVSRILGLNTNDNVPGVQSLRARERSILMSEAKRIGVTVPSNMSLPKLIQFLQDHGANMPKSTLTSLHKMNQALALAQKEHVKANVYAANIQARLEEINNTLKSLLNVGAHMLAPSASKMTAGLGLSAHQRKALEGRISEELMFGHKVPQGLNVGGINLDKNNQVPSHQVLTPTRVSRVPLHASGHSQELPMVMIHGDVVIKLPEVKGEFSAPKAARQIREELLRLSRRNPGQSRGMNPGRSVGHG